jgi:undecaprenyl-diphosphatase
MHDWIVALILGIVEGITEFLPVSSTGHLLIAEKFLHSHQSDLFNVVIQCGAVIAVLPLFPERMYKFFFELRQKETQDYLLKLLVAFAITGAGGLVIDHLNFKLPEELPPVAWALLIGGIAFLAVEFHIQGKKLGEQVTWAVVVAVGCGQLIAAIFPGSSRSGTTILLSLLLGLSRPAATEFSFLVGIPTMMAAGGLKIFKSLHHPDPAAPPENWGLVILATVVAAVVSFIAVKWLLRYVQTHTFNAFGWYRIALALGIFGLLMFAK